MPNTKLDWVNNYKTEYLINEKILRKSVEVHKETLVKANRELKLEHNKGFYVQYRLEDVLISMTDDLIRYATYHKIGQDTTGMYLISEPVRASFITKWILKLRPCIADNNLPTSHQYISSIDVENTDKTRQPTHKIEFCNENLALISASIILGAALYQKGEVVSVAKIVGVSDLPKLFYAFRYRISHQDTYTPLYNKIFEEL